MIRRLLVIVILGVWFLVISSLAYFLPTPYRPLTSEEIATAENLWEYPQPKTEVFRGISLITRADTKSVTKICAELSQFFIWEPGDYGDDVYFNVLRSNEFKLNNVALQSSNLEFWALAIGITRFDNGIKGNVLGSHGGTISACFSTENIPDRLNMAELHFQSTHGKLYGYNWAFKLTRENEIIHVELPDSIWLH